MKHRMGKFWHSYPIVLFWLYVAIWLALAIDPYDRGAWLLENVMVVLVVPLVVWTYYQFWLSNVTYTLIFILQSQQQGVNAAFTTDFAKRPRRATTHISIFILQNKQQGLNATITTDFAKRLCCTLTHILIFILQS